MYATYSLSAANFYFGPSALLIGVLANTKTRAGLFDFRLISLDTCIAVMPVQSSPSTLSNRSPTRTLSIKTLVSLIACTTGIPPLGVSMTMPNLPAGATTSKRSSGSINCSSNEESSAKMLSPILPILLNDKDCCEDIFDMSSEDIRSRVPVVPERESGPRWLR